MVDGVDRFLLREIDKSVERIKAREKKKAEPVPVTVTNEVKQGYLPMSDEDYARALDNARDDVRKANPKMSDSEIEDRARLQADDAKWKYEHSYRTETTTTYKASW